jgi:hypothetical protein
MWMFKRALLEACRPFVLFGYWRREAKRHRNNFPIRWLSQGRLIHDDLVDHADVEGCAVPDSKKLALWCEQRDKAKESAAKLHSAGYAITAYFILTYFAIDMPISVFGVELKKVPGLNELLLIASTTLTVMSVQSLLRANVLEAGIKAAISAETSGPLAYMQRAALLPSEFLPFYSPFYSPHIVWSKTKIRISRVFIVLAVILVICLMIGAITMRYYIYWWVLQNPSIESPILQTGALLAIVVDILVTLGALMYFLPLPHEDFFLLHQLESLKHVFPEDAARLSDQLYSESVRDWIHLDEKGYRPPTAEPKRPL